MTSVRTTTSISRVRSGHMEEGVAAVTDYRHYSFWLEPCGDDLSPRVPVWIDHLRRSGSPRRHACAHPAVADRLVPDAEGDQDYAHLGRTGRDAARLDADRDLRSRVVSRRPAATPVRVSRPRTWPGDCWPA